MRLEFICGLILSVSASAHAAEPLRVVASTSTIASLVKAVSGEDATIETLAFPDEDPHHVKPRRESVAKLLRAELLVYNGRALELGWLPHLVLMSNNPKIQEGAPGSLELAKRVRAIETHLAPLPRRKAIDTHPEGNPHFLLDPEGARIAIDAIVEKLVALRPEKKTEFENRASKFKEQLAAKTGEWKRLTQGHGGRAVLSYHRKWTYLVAWAGMVDAGAIEIRPGVPPSAAELQALERKARSQRVQLIFLGSADPVDAAQKIASAAKAKIVVLPSELSEVVGAKSYLDFMDGLVQKLRSP